MVSRQPKRLFDTTRRHSSATRSPDSVVNIFFREVLVGEEVIPKLWKLAELVSELIDTLDEKIFALRAGQP